MTTTRTPSRLCAAAIFILGFIFAAGGIHLVSLGGSPYYLIAGLGLILSGVMLWRRDRRGCWAYGVIFAATLIWSFFEAGFDPWALVPRTGLLAMLGLWVLLPLGRLWAAMAAGAVLVLLACAASWTHMSVRPTASAPLANLTDPAPGDPRQWPAYANGTNGNRFVHANQITPQNVGKLERVWTFRTGDLPQDRYTFEATPLKIDDALIICSPTHQIISIDADTGKELWRFKPEADHEPGQVGQYCRGVSFHSSVGGTGPCTQRILATTREGHLWALDAKTGNPCPDFGRGGFISQFEGLGPMKGRDTFTTSPGVVVGDRIVLGAWVVDAKSVTAPSGVIRAYDVHTGQLSWAWDMGHPERMGVPPSGEIYTPSTPNSWPPLAADAGLGLVFAPLGNPSPDFFGALRRPFDEQYGSSLVALDAETGRPRWSFQVVHHDLWDLDLPAQPILVDVSAAEGPRPAVVQLSKTGDIYVLDRRTGAPILPVKESPVPQRGKVAEEHLSPTQPVSVASVAPKKLRESDMWGLTPVDQMLCRIRFKEARYDGAYTPPGTSLAIGFPASNGIISWGSGSVDPERGILVVTASYMPFMTQLIPRMATNGPTSSAPAEYSISEMTGTPYRYMTEPMLSALGIPCMRPPWGELAAFDLRDGRRIWTSTLGTTRANGPFGIPSMLPLPIGTPNIGGSVVTSAGLVFIGASTDRYFRAFDIATGQELWRADLPAAAHASPMTYVSRRNGRQFVVVAAGGHGLLPGAQGDYLVAFALPP